GVVRLHLRGVVHLGVRDVHRHRATAAAFGVRVGDSVAHRRVELAQRGARPVAVEGEAGSIVLVQVVRAARQRRREVDAQLVYLGGVGGRQRDAGLEEGVRAAPVVAADHVDVRGPAAVGDRLGARQAYRPGAVGVVEDDVARVARAVDLVGEAVGQAADGRGHDLLDATGAGGGRDRDRVDADVVATGVARAVVAVGIAADRLAVAVGEPDHVVVDHDHV